MNELNDIRKILSELAISQAKTEAQVKITSKIVSGIGVNLGKATELFFYESLADKMALGEIKFDSIHENVIVRKKRKEAEFDILMYNGDSIAIIETKHNVHEGDIDDLMTTKVNNFRSFFPNDAKHKIYLGIAGFAFDKKVQNIAVKHGIAVLKQKGETVSIHAKDLKNY